jgi:hypothetical protein
MASDRNSLANQIDRLIVLADLAWRLPTKPYAHLAHTLFLVGKMYQAAASAQRAELHIMDGNNPE